jgi:hypothetical protein
MTFVATLYSADHSHRKCLDDALSSAVVMQLLVENRRSISAIRRTYTWKQRCSGELEGTKEVGGRKAGEAERQAEEKREARVETSRKELGGCK